MTFLVIVTDSCWNDGGCTFSRKSVILTHWDQGVF